MQYEVLESSGSDASYDLIIEAITPLPEIGYELKLSDREHSDKAHSLALNLVEHFTLRELGWGIRIHLFERFPDAWVWQSRVESLVSKLGKK